MVASTLFRWLLWAHFLRQRGKWARGWSPHTREGFPESYRGSAGNWPNPYYLCTVPWREPTHPFRVLKPGHWSRILNYLQPKVSSLTQLQQEVSGHWGWGGQPGEGARAPCPLHKQLTIFLPPAPPSPPPSSTPPHSSPPPFFPMLSASVSSPCSSSTFSSCSLLSPLFHLLQLFSFLFFCLFWSFLPQPTGSLWVDKKRPVRREDKLQAVVVCSFQTNASSWAPWWALCARRSTLAFQGCWPPATDVRDASGLPLGATPSSRHFGRRKTPGRPRPWPQEAHYPVDMQALDETPLGLTHHGDLPPQVGVCGPHFALISLAYYLSWTSTGEERFHFEDFSDPVFHSRQFLLPSSFSLLSKEKNDGNLHCLVNVWTDTHTYTLCCLGFLSCLVPPNRVRGKQINIVGKKNSILEVNGKSLNPQGASWMLEHRTHPAKPRAFTIKSIGKCHYDTILSVTWSWQNSRISVYT